jgi:hypothetical protein
MTITHTPAVPFKVIDDATNECVGEFASLDSSETYARNCRQDTGHHYRVLELRFVTGTKTLADRDRKGL